jgi:hypothetical protein
MITARPDHNNDGQPEHLTHCKEISSILKREAEENPHEMSNKLIRK